MVVNGKTSSKKEISKTEIFKRPMNFGGAVEIRTQVARPPVLQDGPSYPTAPRSRLCFFNGNSLSLFAIVNYCNQISCINA